MNKGDRVAMRDKRIGTIMEVKDYGVVTPLTCYRVQPDDGSAIVFLLAHEVEPIKGGSYAVAR